MSNNCKARMDTPAGLVIETAVISSSGACCVDSKKSAFHSIEIDNRTPLGYRIAIMGQCETSCIRYGYDADIAESWSDEVLVPPRPPTGGSCKVTLTTDLTCTSASTSEIIRVSVNILPADADYSASPATGSVLLEIRTLG